MKTASVILTIACFNPLFAQNGLRLPTFLEDTITCYSWSNNTWEKDSRVIYTYDADGNRISYASQYWRGTAWRDTSISTYTYDANGILMNEINQDGIYTSKRIYTYDANGNLTYFVNEDWDGTAWIIAGRDTYAYDFNGNQINWVKQNWDGTIWENVSQNNNTYDANGNLINSVKQNWDGTLSSWVNDENRTFAYDANGNQTIYELQFWDGTAWTNVGKVTYSYDANGNQTGFITRYWNGTNWEDGYQVIYTYDVNGNQTSVISQNWDNTLSSWVNSSKGTYIYDVNGTRTSYVSQLWDGTTWVNSNKCEYSYLSISTGNCSADFNLYPDTILHNYFAVNMASGTPPLTYLWSWGDGTSDSIPYPSHTYSAAGLYSICLTIRDSTGCTSTYCDSFNLLRTINTMIYVNVIHPVTVGINDNYDDPFSFLLLSPNPIQNNEVLEYSLQQDEVLTIALYDIHGKLVKQLLTHESRSKGAHKESLHFGEALPAGNYVLRITNGSGSMGVKVVK